MAEAQPLRAEIVLLALAQPQRLQLGDARLRLGQLRGGPAARRSRPGERRLGAAQAPVRVRHRRPTLEDGIAP
jgi:hypothetical protein